MCEILLCVKTRWVNTENFAWECKQPKQGDVVSVQEDGWPWGLCELGLIDDGPQGNGNYSHLRIIKFPNVSVAQALTMMAGEKDIDPQNPSPYLQYRAKFLDKTLIANQALLNYLANDLRQNPSITIPFTAAQLSAIVATRPPIPF